MIWKEGHPTDLIIRRIGTINAWAGAQTVAIREFHSQRRIGAINCDPAKSRTHKK
jgi:hypothetical protein